MIGQMHILDYLEDEEVNYIKCLAHCLRVWDRTWRYGYLEKLKNESNLDVLYETFCNTNKHYFVLKGDLYHSEDKDVYGAYIDKKENVLRMYKCGSDSEKIIATEPVSKLLDELVQG